MAVIHGGVVVLVMIRAHAKKCRNVDRELWVETEATNDVTYNKTTQAASQKLPNRFLMRLPPEIEAATSSSAKATNTVRNWPCAMLCVQTVFYLGSCLCRQFSKPEDSIVAILWSMARLVRSHCLGCLLFSSNGCRATTFNTVLWGLQPKSNSATRA